MTRIVAGSLGGRTLKVPGQQTRPTSDRVREALFSSLEHLDAVAGAHVLDVFAGSGALALEAMSRGAASAVLVDTDRQAVLMCRENVRALGLTGQVQVVADRAERYLERTGVRVCADLVFVDPPYALSTESVEKLLQMLASSLCADALVVVERSTRSVPVQWPDGFTSVDSRRYGETAIQLGRLDPEESAVSAETTLPSTQ